MPSYLDQLKAEYKEREEAIAECNELLKSAEFPSPYDFDSNRTKIYKGSTNYERILRQRDALTAILADYKQKIETAEVAESLKFVPSATQKKIWDAFLTLSTDEKLNFIASKLLFQ